MPRPRVDWLARIIGMSWAGVPPRSWASVRSRRPEGARSDGPVARRHRPDRDQRGVRGAGDRVRARAEVRARPPERARRRDLARPPDRHERARIIPSLAYAMRSRGAALGLATLCISGVARGSPSCWSEPEPMSVHAVVLIECEIDEIPEAAGGDRRSRRRFEVYSVAGEFDLVAIVRVANHDDLATVIPGGSARLMASRGRRRSSPSGTEARPRAPVLDRLLRRSRPSSVPRQIDRDRTRDPSPLLQAPSSGLILLEQQPSRERVFLGIAHEAGLADQVSVAEPKADRRIEANVLHPVAPSRRRRAGRWLRRAARTRSRSWAARTPALRGSSSSRAPPAPCWSPTRRPHDQSDDHRHPTSKNTRSPRLTLPGCTC